MPKGKPKKKYSGEFKQQVVETMHQEHLGYKETERRYELSNNRAAKWERIYLEEGPKGLYVERRGRSSNASGVRKGRPPNLEKKVEEDLIAENQRLRAENDYLKKLNALVSERVQREKNHKS